MKSKNFKLTNGFGRDAFFVVVLETAALGKLTATFLVATNGGRTKNPAKGRFSDLVNLVNVTIGEELYNKQIYLFMWP